MKKKSKKINSCQISGVQDLKKIISIGPLPPVNKIRKTTGKKKETVLFDTDLMYSQTSKLVQLNTIVDKTVLFPKEYPYFLKIPVEVLQKPSTNTFTVETLMLECINALIYAI